MTTATKKTRRACEAAGVDPVKRVSSRLGRADTGLRNYELESKFEFYSFKLDCEAGSPRGACAVFIGVSILYFCFWKREREREGGLMGIGADRLSFIRDLRRVSVLFKRFSWLTVI